MRKASPPPSPRRTAGRRAGPDPTLQRHANGPRRVLLTGASGFVGREVKRQLLTEGWEVVAVARRLSKAEAEPGVIQVAADVTGDGWQQWCDGCTAAVHLVGIIREVRRRGVTFDRLHRVAAEKVVAACRASGIGRLVHMSALGAQPNAAAIYHRTKWQGEEVVRGSGLAWTIMRPSLVCGPGSGFESEIAPKLRAMPVFPVFGDGTYRLQPIAVADVARAFVAALDLPDTAGQTYELGGPEALAYDDLLRRMLAALGIRRALVHLPLGLARALVSMLEHLPGAPITRDQLAMLLAGSTCDTAASTLAFGVPTERYAGPTWMQDRTSSPPRPTAAGAAAGPATGPGDRR